ncbi:capsule assembly Wzi family protein [Ferrimonas aestuarii]|uniref:Capsule assembly Wzi family protein n=1 Tax=Ferrimonas aestuarii TaxID=2569539 RepID=A0A4U1BQZ9_9GAMM|nr:capsule assembly Wzi family protein [Ferrimonas aestuarii]TKB53961.1 capsule assembly Wzi family protein [Ferrimonas aestuarii]
MSHALRPLFTVLSLLTCTVQAAPWVNPDDVYLRADIQRLADEGVITVPVNTFPLMWSGILTDLKNANGLTLSDESQDALYRVRRRAQWETDGGLTAAAEFGGASDTPRFQHFDSTVRETGEATVSAEYLGSRFSGKLSVTYAADAQDDESLRFDDSYLAMVWGNWVFSAGQQAMWWGPGWDTALTMSTNARPLPSVNLSRNHAHAFETKWLSWIGPWTLNTGIGWLNDDRTVEDTLLWTFRASAKPIPQLEIGISRSAQLCGDGRDCGFDTWKSMLTGDDNTGSLNEPGNQLAAVDMRFSGTLFELPVGLYAESMGEDSFRLDRFPPFQAKSYLFGADISYALGNSQIRHFLEFSDTSPKCNGEYNCAYEHFIYKTGYRYQKRNIGSTYDNDAYTYTFGTIANHRNGHQWQVNLRYLDLNHDNSNSVNGPNTVTDQAEQVSQVEARYQFPLLKGKLELSAEVSYSQFKEKSNETNSTFWAQWSWQLSL